MENNKKRKQKPEQLVEEKPRKERVMFSAPLLHQNLTSTMAFDWPEFMKESQRIKAYSKRFANTDINEIFGVKTKLTCNSNETPIELNAGDIINLKIRSITKDGVTFETRNTKQVVLSNINLYKYEKFRKFLPSYELKAEVIKANREIVYVDIFKPMIDEWLKDILKDPDIQRNVRNDKSIKVKNLHLTHGGFIGQAVVPSISEFVGQDYMIEAFVPGSQIVLNIEENFEKWEGKTIDVFVSNYIDKPGTKNQKSLICSRKDLLRFIGDQNIIKIFDNYCRSGEEWSNASTKQYEGVVTGIINSSKKCGVFVELPELNITGMAEVKPDELVNYKPQDKIIVSIKDFEENLYFDQTSQQMKHDLPYVIENDILKSCDIKPILKMVR